MSTLAIALNGYGYGYILGPSPVPLITSLIYLAVGSFGPVPSRVDKLHPLRPCLYM